LYIYNGHPTDTSVRNNALSLNMKTLAHFHSGETRHEHYIMQFN